LVTTIEVAITYGTVIPSRSGGLSVWFEHSFTGDAPLRDPDIYLPVVPEWDINTMQVWRLPPLPSGWLVVVQNTTGQPIQLGEVIVTEQIAVIE
jgi:hypothetical protein